MEGKETKVNTNFCTQKTLWERIKGSTHSMKDFEICGKREILLVAQVFHFTMGTRASMGEGLVNF